MLVLGRAKKAFRRGMSVVRLSLRGPISLTRLGLSSGLKVVHAFSSPRPASKSGPLPSHPDQLRLHLRVVLDRRCAHFPLDPRHLVAPERQRRVESAVAVDPDGVSNKFTRPRRQPLSRFLSAQFRSNHTRAKLFDPSGLMRKPSTSGVRTLNSLGWARGIQGACSWKIARAWR